jgi:hypothetical protein
MQNYTFSGHMVCSYGVNGSSAIIVGVILFDYSVKNEVHSTKISSLIKHSFTNGSVLLITGV